MIEKRSLLSRIFLSPDEPRLRAAWRLTAQFAMMLSVVFVLTLLVILSDLMGVPGSVTLLINQLAIFVAITGTVPLARRFIDRRSVVSLGLRRRHAISDLVAGFVIAGMVMGAIFLFEWRTGWLTVESFVWQNRSWRDR